MVRWSIKKEHTERKKSQEPFVDFYCNLCCEGFLTLNDLEIHEAADNNCHPGFRSDSFNILQMVIMIMIVIMIVIPKIIPESSPEYQSFLKHKNNPLKQLVYTKDANYDPTESFAQRVPKEQIKFNLHRTREWN